jgi:hypothetical protein
MPRPDGSPDITGRITDSRGTLLTLSQEALELLSVPVQSRVLMSADMTGSQGRKGGSSVKGRRPGDSREPSLMTPGAFCRTRCGSEHGLAPIIMGTWSPSQVIAGLPRAPTTQADSGALPCSDSNQNYHPVHNKCGHERKVADGCLREGKPP